MRFQAFACTGLSAMQHHPAGIDRKRSRSSIDHGRNTDHKRLHLSEEVQIPALSCSPSGKVFQEFPPYHNDLGLEFEGQGPPEVHAMTDIYTDSRDALLHTTSPTLPDAGTNIGSGGKNPLLDRTLANLFLANSGATTGGIAGENYNACFGMVFYIRLVLAIKLMGSRFTALCPT